jgi:hypothetical protein
MKESITVDETAEEQNYRHTQLRLLPWRCARAGILSLPLVVAIYLLFGRWGARFPPIEWTLPVAIPASMGLRFAIDLAPRRFVFSQEGFQLLRHIGFWIRDRRVEWKAVQRWTLQPSRLNKQYAMASFYLSWGRRLNVSVHVSRQGKIENLLQRFGRDSQMAASRRE